jgi:hypothetical protein
MLEEYTDPYSDDPRDDVEPSDRKMRWRPYRERSQGLDRKFAKGAVIGTPISLLLWYLILRLLHLV